MIKLLSEPHEIRQEIARVLLSGAPARAAVAFWGQDAEKALAISRDMVKQCQLKIICDLESGACNPATIRKLIDADTQVRFLKKLHAKVYLGNGEAVIGSANASANGLGLEGREVGGSKEVCIVTNDEAVVSQCECWFTNMWESATKIEEDDLRGAELAWRLRRKHRPMVRDSDRDLLAALRSNMPSFANREIYVRVDMAEISKAAEKAAEDEIGGAWTSHGIYEDWNDIPPDACIIGFLWEADKHIKFDGLFRSPSNPHTACHTTELNSIIVICEKIKSIAGYRVPSTGKNAEIWKRAAAGFATSRGRPAEGCFIPLDEFAKQFLFQDELSDR